MTRQEAFEKWCAQEDISPAEFRREVWDASRSALLEEIKADGIQVWMRCPKSFDDETKIPLYRLPDEGEV